MAGRPLHAQRCLTRRSFYVQINPWTHRALSTIQATLPSPSGIRPGRVVRARDRGRGGLDRRADGSLVSREGAAWGTFAAGSALLIAFWVTVGVTTGGLAWLPWFLLIIVPWGVAIARRPQS